MTREEEAIKILKEDGCGYCTWQSINPYECENKECKVKEALNRAIQALSQVNDYLHGLNAVGKIDYIGYSELYDACMPILEECYNRMEEERKAESEE